MPNPPTHPPGHFYSPIVDTDEAVAAAARIWPERPEILGIDFNDASHLEVLEQWFPRFIGDYDYPERLEQPAPAPTGLRAFLRPAQAAAEARQQQELRDDDRFYTCNSQFSWLDARALFVLLRAWRPARVIEVGSGYSSLLMADINRRFLDGACEITCVEPYPRPFLRRGVPGIARLVQAKVQDVPLELFAALGAGDVLFIDSSHVAKTGSDVNHLYFEVMPRLVRGVRIHIHDIHLPHDYLREWVVDENRSWNEQYLLRALLMHSTAFKVLFGCNYAQHRWPEKVVAALALPSGRGFGGGSFWIERT